MDAPGSGAGRRHAHRVLGLALSAARSRRRLASHLSPPGPRRLVGAVGLAVLVAAALAGCSGSSPPPLTAKQVPAALKLQANTQSHLSANLAKAFNGTFPGCPATYAVFTLGGRAPTPVLTGKTIYPQLFSGTATCSDQDTATTLFDTAAKKAEGFGAKKVTGVGSAAIITSETSKTATSYDVFWRDGAVLGSIQLSGPSTNHLISAAETELLARRQITGP